MLVPPSGARPVDVQRETSIDGGAGTSGAGEREEINAIYTCKFPGCTRQYASTDGVRKHCRKSHAEWLREVDMEKASLGCRWAAYCTRQIIEDGGDDPRTTPVGSKRAREIIAEGEAQYKGTFYTSSSSTTAAGGGGGGEGGVRPTSSSTSAFGSSTSVNASEEPPRRPIGPDQAFGGLHGKALVPPRRESSSENVVPPDMVAVPNDSLTTPLPAQESKLTPNAQARQRLGEIADCDGMAASVASQSGAPSGFFAWGMPPLKRGLSLADTRDALPPSVSTPLPEGAPADDTESIAPPSRNESFLDSILASS